MECIVLAGGLGTRLQRVIGNYPKCMAEINGKPFLHYLFEYLEQQSCNKVVLALGFKHEVIVEWLRSQNMSFEIDYVIEETPLGTGGGISLALKKTKEERIIVLNGDTMFRVNLNDLMGFHQHHAAETTLALKRLKDFDRYGVVRTDETGRIIQFEEKKYMAKGMINGGIYCIDKSNFSKRILPEKYSFEKDYLEVAVHEKQLYGYSSDDYFIDIGIPEDYNRAQEEFKQFSR